MQAVLDEVIEKVAQFSDEDRDMLVLPDKSLFTEAYFMTGLYFLAFVMIFILYYGIHHLSYGKVS